MKTALFVFLIVATLGSAHNRTLLSAERNSHGPVPFTVDSDVTVHLARAQAQAILQQGLAILSRVDVPDHDVETNLPLVFTGGVGSFSLRRGIVKSCKDLNRLFRRPGNVHVVRDIHCCGGIKGAILGCSAPNRPLVVVSEPGFGDANTLISGILWMHEYGHNRGLCHRVDRSAIMDPTIAFQHITVNACEHDHYLGHIKKPCDDTGYPRVADPHPNVVDFVHQVFIEGVPYEQASVFTKDDIQHLLPLLQIQDQEPYWDNIVTVLGIIGDMSVYEPLKQFLETDSGGLSQASYRAKHDVPIALGYLLANTNSPDVLQYLKDGLHPSEWANRIGWKNVSAEEQHEHHAHLATMAILGLAVSGRVGPRTGPRAGHNEAAEALRGLRNQFSVLNLERSEFEDGTKELLHEATDINRVVERAGLLEYYRRNARTQLGNCHD